MFTRLPATRRHAGGVAQINWSILIRSLDHGGAQRQALVLAKALHERGERVQVVTFYEGGALQRLIDGCGVRVVCLRKRGRWDVLGLAYRLFRELRAQEPQVLYPFLTVPNVISALLRPLLRRTLVVWGVRASNMELAHYDWFARITDSLERRLSRRADLIIVNSRAGREYAVARGFPPKRTISVTNGIDTTAFAPSLAGRQRVRREWGVKDEDLLVGLAARVDPMKDHETFIKAAAIVAARHREAVFVCVGTGPAANLEQAKRCAHDHGIGARVLWIGARDDMSDVYCAFDIACSASRFGEGFSNAIAEALACGTPCVATNVGDSAELIADARLLSDPGNADQLAESLLRLAAITREQRLALGRTARKRIEGNYSVDMLARRTIAAVMSNSRTEALAKILERAT